MSFWGKFVAGAATTAALALVAVAHADPTPQAALTDLNTWRTSLGEAPATTLVSAWNTGCQHHNTYEYDNGKTLSHPETPGNPGYTSDGAEAGPDSVLAEEVSSPTAVPDSDLLPRAAWEAAVFHRDALLQPRLRDIGFSSSTFDSSGDFYSFVCLWDQTAMGVSPNAMDNSAAARTPALTLYPSPGNGAANVPVAFPGGESPDPAQETGVPSGAHLGWLISVAINGPWADAYYGNFVYARSVTATLVPDAGGPAVPIVISQHGTSEGDYLDGGFGIFPTQPLHANTTYRVTVSGKVTDGIANVDYPFSNRTWCFSTGTYVTSASCHTGKGTSTGTGTTGPTGSTGSTGSSGATGSTGVTGATGPSGSTGSSGSSGSTGSSGASGSTGGAGSTGATGVTGPVGPVAPTQTAAQIQSGSSSSSQPPVTVASTPPTPTVTIPATPLTFDRSGAVNVKLACPGGDDFCDGTVTVTTLRGFAARAKRKAKPLVLGSAHFHLAGGASTTITVKLSRKALAKLPRRGTTVVLAITDQDGAGATASSKRTLTLKPAPVVRKRVK
jgi:hypothetical protein